MKVKLGAQEISGVAVDVAADGALLVEKPGGEVEKIISGEIQGPLPVRSGGRYIKPEKLFFEIFDLRF